MNAFRLLRADEIDCRVSQIKENGLSLLLYKDARCDMNILDETVGPFNWKRQHSRDNANCTVSLYDEEKCEWVSKEDTGTESNTEAQKGLASDSFKRACFNWGVGRELYTAPFIWVGNDKCTITKKDNGKFVCYDNFTVQEIRYNDNQEISALSIMNTKTRKAAFVWQKGQIVKAPEETPEEAPKYDKPADTYEDGNFVPRCADCGAEISVKVHDYSVKRFKRPLCFNCQKNA